MALVMKHLNNDMSLCAILELTWKRRLSLQAQCIQKNKYVFVLCIENPNNSENKGQLKPYFFLPCSSSPK